MKGGDNDVMFIDGNTGSRGKGKVIRIYHRYYKEISIFLKY